MKEYSHTYFLTAGECDAESRMPMPLIVSRLIEVATEHANAWGVGYSRLKESGQAWVLSRISVEMMEYPHVNEEYAITTWVESYNRHFSERNFVITAGGEEVGYARSVWMVIDTARRTLCDISQLSYISENVSERRSPMTPITRLTPVSARRSESYTFGYIDVDSNRHVNSVSYIKLLMNKWSLDFYDRHRIARLEMAYIKECLCGMTVNVLIDDSNPLDCTAEIEAGGTGYCRARIVFAESEYRAGLNDCNSNNNN